MDFETDPAAEFLNRERAELGDLENEIIAPNGKQKINDFHKCYFSLTLSIPDDFSPAEPSGEPLSSDDFEMINNENPSDIAENNDGESHLLFYYAPMT